MPPSEFLGAGPGIASTLRAPALAVFANGAPLGGVTEARILSVNNFAADRFTVRAALSAADPSVWQSDSIDVAIQLGLDGAFTTMIQGVVDAVEIDPMSYTLQLSGRDYTAAFIAAQTQESFQNQTSSDIAMLLAGRHGLSVSATATATPVGRYYEIEHDSITLNQYCRATSEWDMLTFLARQEGFELWIAGATLYFQPPDLTDVAMLTPLDCTDLRMHRALTLAQDIAVTVKSWNSRQQNGFTQTAKGRAGASGGAGMRSAGMGGGGVGIPPQHYMVVRPNLTPDQALALAQQILADLSRHEREVLLTMPGELEITPRTQLALSGTSTDFDQSYVIAEVERMISFERGFIQRIRACNPTPV